MTNARLLRWHPQLRRAVEKARPEYFGWSAQRRDRYGARIPQEDLQALRGILRDPGAVWRESPLVGGTTVVADKPAADEQRRWDEVLLPLRGIGADYFYLDDPPDLNQEWTVADFETVREFDETVCRFQHTPATAQYGNLGSRPYRGALYFNRAQLYVDGRFTYATLSMAAGYIYARLSDCWRKLLLDRIPYHYVDGRQHGKVAGNSWVWDMRLMADGKEDIVEELQRRIWRYQWERFHSLHTTWDAARRSRVYLLRDEQRSSNDDLDIVFSDKEALSRVCFRSFIRDCRSIEAAAMELSDVAHKEEVRLEQFIDEQYAVVMRERPGRPLAGAPRSNSAPK